MSAFSYSTLAMACFGVLSLQYALFVVIMGGGFWKVDLISLIQYEVFYKVCPFHGSFERKLSNPCSWTEIFLSLRPTAPAHLA